MFVNHEFNEEDPHFLDPVSRKVNFDDDSYLCMVTDFLRLAWVARPTTTDITLTSLNDYMTEVMGRPSRALTEDEINPDRKRIETRWRMQVQATWQVVFQRVMKLLNGASGTVGTWDSNFTLVVPFPESEDAAAIESKVFDHNLILIPVFLNDGVGIRITRDREPTDDDPSTEYEVETFTTDLSSVLRYLRHDIAFNFYVDRDETDCDTDEPAAVFAVGVLVVDQYVTDKMESIHQMDAEREAAGLPRVIGPDAKSSNYLPPDDDNKSDDEQEDDNDDDDDDEEEKEEGEEDEEDDEEEYEDGEDEENSDE